MIPFIVLTPLIGAGVSMAVGTGMRYLMGDKTPAEPHELALDAALGAISMGTYGVASAPLRAVATSAASRIAVGAVSGALSGAVTELAEDYLRPTIYSSELAPKEVREEWSKVQPKPNLEEMMWGAAGGAVLGGIAEGVSYGVEQGKIPVPKLGKVTPTQQEKWYGLYIEKGPEAKPVFGIYKQSGKWGVHLGDFEFKTFSQIPEIQPKSPIETKLIKNAIKNYFRNVKGLAMKGEALPTAVQIEKTINVVAKDDLKNTPIIKGLRNVLKEDMPRFSDIADDTYSFLIRRAKKGDLIVYGSSAQKMQMGRYMTRELHDIDLVANNPQKVANQFLNVLKRKLGNSVRLNPENPTIIERYMNGRWVKLMEVHDKGSLLSYLFGQGEKYIGHGFRPQTPMKTEEGLKIMRLSEQLIRKGVSSTQVAKEGLRPELHRLKDIYDFEEITKFYIKRANDLGYKSIANQLKNLLNKFVKAQTPELRREIMKQVGRTLRNSGVENQFILYFRNPLGYGYSYVLPSQWIMAIIPYNVKPKEPKSKYKPSKYEPTKSTQISPYQPSQSTSGYSPPSSPPPSEIPSSKPPSDYYPSFSYPSLPSYPSIIYPYSSPPSYPSVSSPYYPPSPPISTYKPTYRGMYPIVSIKAPQIQPAIRQEQLQTYWEPEL